MTERRHSVRSEPGSLLSGEGTVQSHRPPDRHGAALMTPLSAAAVPTIYARVVSWLCGRPGKARDCRSRVIRNSAVEVLRA
jgi:hypothetical protein